ncbi:SDR family NAD(P)-dependent oxidoreductase [Bdellovibrio sp. SKB1291214]|uniref:SDR family NAD(P)-dependent oxidoreductase n=1 Tax=Bdellovibrio sp. SKB1291214 TaxID=1732569 RepID=UPI000B51BD3F|nr:SDR family NAD(P)-dependent oxidoreductase [Bdellovibrio sp. SKB1291214]UYL07389.1 SDR family NAD(P)-dependent oxidoreductase [Bdellovibrio sp. SKB1291214]
MAEKEKFEKKLAVVTGASSGIGYYLAHEFAKNGYDLVIVAEDAGIHTAADAFREHGNLVHVVQADLTEPQGIEATYQKILSINCPVESIALNAGIGVGGATFDKTSLNQEIKMLKLNVISTVHLAKLVLRDMLAKGHGRILFTSSVAAIMPGPYEAVYSGTKAFIQFFAEALRAENIDKGITVTALLPGPTETNFFARAGMEDTKVGQSKKDDAQEVAEMGFKALMEGKDMVVAGSFMNKVQTTMAKMMPQSIAAKMHGNMSKPNSPDKR